MIEPIGARRQGEVITEVARYLRFAADHYSLDLDRIPVLFNLKGRTAGMYRIKKTRRFAPDYREIRFNPWLFSKYPEDSWCNTIPHEVAHYVVDCLYPNKSVRPHGAEWRQVMLVFGAEPSVRANYDLTGIPMRKIQYYGYQCGCRQVQISLYRHKKIQQGIQIYRCTDCSQPLTLADTY